MRNISIWQCMSSFIKKRQPLFPPFLIICIKSKFLLLYILATLFWLYPTFCPMKKYVKIVLFMAILWLLMKLLTIPLIPLNYTLDIIYILWYGDSLFNCENAKWLLVFLFHSLLVMAYTILKLSSLYVLISNVMFICNQCILLIPESWQFTCIKNYWQCLQKSTNPLGTNIDTLNYFKIMYIYQKKRDLGQWPGSTYQRHLIGIWLPSPATWVQSQGLW